MKERAPIRHTLAGGSRGEPREEHALDPARERFDVLFRANAGRVYAYARRRSSHDEAQEVVAETFLVAWRRLDDVPREPLPWLLGVARKVLANRRRAAGRRFDLRVTLAPMSSPGPDPSDEVQTKLDVLAAIDRLPTAEREALTLSAWDGLSAAEGAAVIGCTRATFTVRLHRARRRLMKELAGSEHFSGGSTTSDGPDNGTPAAGNPRANEEAETR
jgi:RNA polymerase sigma-70 factor (ECF subfamily)